jgi:hypothetical protein
MMHTNSRDLHGQGQQVLQGRRRSSAATSLCRLANTMRTRLGLMYAMHAMQVMQQRLRHLQAQLLRRPVSAPKPPANGADAIAGTKKHKAHALTANSGPAHVW